MEHDLELLNADITDFISHMDRIKFQDFDYRLSKAKDFSVAHSSIKLKNLIGLVTKEQDGTYPGRPTFEVAKLGVHILWVLSENVDALFKVAETKKAPWYVKVEALDCLHLTPIGIPWREVVNLIKNKHLENEVKRAAMRLIVFHNRIDLLPELKAIDLKALEDDYFASELRKHIILTRAALGDTDVILPLLEYRNDPWYFTHQPAAAAWTQLSDKLGGDSYIAKAILESSNLPSAERFDNIWSQLQEHDNQTVVQWAISKAPASVLQTKKCVSLLSSSIWAIRDAAADWLIKHQTSAAPLLSALSDSNQSRIAQSWAAFVLSKTSENPALTLKPYLKDQDVFKKPWAFEAADIVREAIIKHYVPNCENGTDIRYNIELTLSEHGEYDTAKTDRDALVTELKQQGLSIEFCNSIGENRQQGAGTYWVVKVPCEDTHIYLNISTLGKFIDCAHQSKDFEFLDATPESHPNIALCKKIAEGLGFLWLESAFLENYVPGLNVYFFGSREPLQILDLLFYWQD